MSQPFVTPVVATYQTLAAHAHDIAGRYVSPHHVIDEKMPSDRVDEFFDVVAQAWPEVAGRVSPGRTPTLLHILALLHPEISNDDWVALSDGPRRIFLVAGSGASVLQFVDLAVALGSDYAVYAQHNRATLRRRWPEITLASSARRAVRTMRRIAPAGPYICGGHSIGGLVSLRMATTLRQRGSVVERVILLDARPGPRMLKNGELPVAPRLVEGRPESWWHLGCRLLADRLRRSERRHLSVLFDLGLRRRDLSRRVPVCRAPGLVVASSFSPAFTLTAGEALFDPAPRSCHVDGGHSSFLGPPDVSEVAACIKAALGQSSPPVV